MGTKGNKKVYLRLTDDVAFVITTVHGHHVMLYTDLPVSQEGELYIRNMGADYDNDSVKSLACIEKDGNINLIGDTDDA